jgi:hypothetical protein
MRTLFCNIQVESNKSGLNNKAKSKETSDEVGFDAYGVRFTAKILSVGFASE